MHIRWMQEPEHHPTWPAIKALLQPAADVGGIEPYEPGDMVWLATENGTVFAAMTTRFANGVAEIRCVGGTRLRDWLPAWANVFEDWARACGADWLECRGRKGWGRFAERFGWRFSHTDQDGLPVFEKEL